MPSSKLQDEVALTLSKRYPGIAVVIGSRPDWLITDRGERLELDIFLPSINVAIEVNGAQHYQFVPFFHGSYDEFESQQRRDSQKYEICSKAGVYLLEVFDYVSKKEAIEFVVDMVEVRSDRHSAIKKFNRTIRADYNGTRNLFNKFKSSGNQKTLARAWKSAHRIQSKIAVTAEMDYSFLQEVDDQMLRACFNLFEKMKRGTRKYNKSKGK